MTIDDYLGLGKPTSNIGFGCARLVGRDSLRRSAKLVESALECGIRHFDVAPSYGYGTAEEVLGAVLGTVPDVTITTKVGIQRPPYPRGRALARRVLKPLVGRHGGSLREIATTLKGRTSATDVQRARFSFTPEAIRASLEASLTALRRESVDVFLLHEPAPHDLDEEVERCFRKLVDDKLIARYGVGIDGASDRWSRFGSVWQSRWPGDGIGRYAGDVTYVFHGAVRYAASHDEGAAPTAVVRGVLGRVPRSIVLVSTSSTRHLRELVDTSRA